MSAFRKLFEVEANVEDEHRSQRYSSSQAENRVRTEKARMAKQLKKEREAHAGPASHSAKAAAATLLGIGSCEQEAADHEKEDVGFRERLCKNFLTPDFFSIGSREPYKDNNKRLERERCRAVSSVLHVLANTLRQLFCPRAQPLHILNCATVDDTSTRMRGPSPSDPTTIFTIMNHVMTLHASWGDSRDGECPLSLPIPTPLVVLETPSADTISSACAASVLVSSQGVGQWFQQLGIDAALFQRLDQTFKTFAFVGDSLKANSAACALERTRILEKREVDSSFRKTLYLQLKRSIHQVGLIRKPVVLAIPQLWTTLVRLSHLFEVLSFRKNLAAALTSIICSSFVHVQAPAFPREMHAWKDQASRLMSFYGSIRSKRRKKLLAAALDHCNGDLSQLPVCHFCKFQDGSYCCQDRQQALTKTLRLVVPFFSGGYPVPLLYRFKHYDEAAGFVLVGARFHQLLIQALGRLDDCANMAEAGMSSDVIGQLLGDLDAQMNDGELQDAINDLAAAQLDAEVSFQASNMKRRQLVQKSVSRPDFTESMLILNILIQPFGRILNAFLARTSRISSLTVFSKELQTETCQEMVSKSKALFLDYVLGRVGWQMIGAYMQLLQSSFSIVQVEHGLCPSESRMQTVFTLLIVCISDSWRRLVHAHASFPWKMFQLIDGIDQSRFCTLWDSFQADMKSRPCCVDAEFSQALLSCFPAKLASEPVEVERAVCAKVSRILSDIAIFTPISSDTVEMKNGRVQHIVSRRGNQAVKAPRAARESSFLMAVIRNHQLVKNQVDELTLPQKKVTAGILKRSGARSTVNPASWLNGMCTIQTIPIPYIMCFALSFC